MSESISSEYADINKIRLHYLRAGQGRPVLLLHGWPEFSAIWCPVMSILADRGFDVIAPDLRGFGDSDKQGLSSEVGADVHAADLLALLNYLGVPEIGIVSHDVGAVVAQRIGRDHAERLSGLMFFNCSYPGIGSRWGEPAHLKQVWHLYFNQMPFAAALTTSSRETMRIFLSHFLTHWAGRKDAFNDVLEEWVDNFLKPGNMQGGFNWYLSAHAARIAVMSGTAPTIHPIRTPTCVRWGTEDPVLPISFADRLGDYFSDLDFKPFAGAGHFPHFEFPERAAQEIEEFFNSPRLRPATTTSLKM